eukprot:6208269-Pleurochrysis_carterae.AAC.4
MRAARRLNATGACCVGRQKRARQTRYREEPSRVPGYRKSLYDTVAAHAAAPRRRWRRVVAMVCAAQVSLDGDAAFCVDIDSKAQLVAVGLISGRVKIYDYAQWQPVQRCNAKPHKKACRALSFSDDGGMLYTAGSDSQLQQRDVATNKAVWKQPAAHGSAINTLSLLDANGVGTADDDGGIKLWDLRDHSVAMTFKEHTDYVSQMLFVPSRGPAIAATSGDGHLSVYDLRRGRLEALSDDMEDELLCAALVKGGKKLLCGMGEGVVGIFSWGNFGDINDRLIGHTEAVEAMVAYNDDMVRTRLPARQSCPPWHTSPSEFSAIVVCQWADGFDKPEAGFLAHA